MSPDSPDVPSRRIGLRLSRKMVFFGLILLLVLAGTATLILLHNSKTPSQSSKGAVYYDRPGFDRKSLSTGIGDPAVLHMNPVETAVQYHNASVVQACNVLSLDDLRRNKLELHPATSAAGESGLRRNFMDATTQVNLKEPLSVAVTSDQDLNNCRYQMYTGGKTDAGIHIAVYQLFDTNNGAFIAELQQHYSKVDPIEDIAVFLKKPDSNPDTVSSEYILRSGQGASVHLTFLGEAAHLAQKDALVKAAAINLQSQLTHPTGPSVPAFKSPIFKQKVVRACDLVNADDVRQLTSQAAAPFVEEGLATATGVLNFGGSAATNYAFAETACTRRTSGGGSGIGTDSPVAQTIDVLARSFQNNQGAQLYLQAARQDPANKQPTDLGKQLGDEAFAFTYIATNDNEIMLRKGHVVVKLVFNQFHQLGELRDQHKATQKLLPLAQGLRLE